MRDMKKITIDGEDYILTKAQPRQEENKIISVKFPDYNDSSKFKVHISMPVSPDKSALIQKAIEAAINEEKLYTQKELEEAERAAFKESRLTHPIVGFKHDKYEDYKQSKR